MNGEGITQASQAEVGGVGSHATPPGIEELEPVMSPRRLARIALAIHADEPTGLALAAAHGLGPTEGRALSDRLAARADEVFSERTEQLELELAVCREELSRLVYLYEERRSSPALGDAAAMLARGCSYCVSKGRGHARKGAQHLPEPLKAFIRRCIRDWR